MTDDFDDFEIEKEELDVSELDKKIMNGPVPGSPEWHDFVMALLEDGEFAEDKESGNKYPCCHGLRRVATLLFGKLTGGVKDIIYPDASDPRRVVVVYELLIGDPAEGVPLERYTEVSDSSLDNTDPFFLEHAVATASTKAQARCLKNALLIKTVTADEIKNADRSKIMGLEVGNDTLGDYNDKEHISSRQLNYIDKLAAKADVDVDKFVEAQFGKKMDAKDLTVANGSKLGSLLDDYRGGREEIPEEIKGYKKNWRDE